MADPLSSITGLSSGIDWKSLVDSIITQDKAPATKMQATIDAAAQRKAGLEQIRKALAALKTASDGLKDGSALDVFSATTVGTDASGRGVAVATVAPGSAATTGSYALHVTALATAQKTVGASGWTGTQTLAAGGTLTLGGVNIAVQAGDTLAGVRDRINAQAMQTGVQASVLSANADGSDQRLVLTGTKTGATSAFTLGDTGGGSLAASLGFPAGTPNVTSAADAALTIDGVSVTRPSNTISDAIAGVALTLSTTGDSALTVNRQSSASTAAVQAFVDAYNQVRTTIANQGGATGALRGDSLVRTLGASLASTALTPATTPGVAPDLASLSALGISVQRDGTLALDKAAFAAAYPARDTDVRALFADRLGAFSSLADSYTASATGNIDQREAVMDDQSATLRSRIDDLNTRLDKKRTALLAQYATFEATLGRLKSVGDAMSAQFASLNKSNSSN